MSSRKRDPRPLGSGDVGHSIVVTADGAGHGASSRGGGRVGRGTVGGPQFIEGRYWHPALASAIPRRRRLGRRGRLGLHHSEIRSRRRSGCPPTSGPGHGSATPVALLAGRHHAAPAGICREEPSESRTMSFLGWRGPFRKIGRPTRRCRSR